MNDYESALKKILDLKSIVEESEKILAFLRDDPPGQRLVIVPDGKGGAGKLLKINFGGIKCESTEEEDSGQGTNDKEHKEKSV